MMRSMFAGVSGLRSHQLMMDVVSDNIGNINTTGFKSSRVVFSDTLSQLLRGAGAADAAAGRGGINAQQVGLGTRVNAIDVVSTQGAIQNTGRSTDVAIQGEGYFVVRSGAETLFTRAGAFNFDSAGNLVDATGYILRGYLADGAGQVDTTGPLQDIQLPLGQSIPPQATTRMQLGGNLSAATAAGESVVSSEDIFDVQGNAQRVTLTFTKGASAGAWTLSATGPDGSALGSAAIQFDAAGRRTVPAGNVTFTRPGSGGGTFAIDLGAAGTPGALTQYGGSTNASVIDQDGSATGYLKSFAIADDGTVSGVFSNGRSRPLARLALAVFPNPGGMEKAGANHLRAGNNAGLPNVGPAGAVGRGSLAAGALEMSNVDLGQEFTNLIIAQRGFQANSRIISASDELLQDLVNLKR